MERDSPLWECSLHIPLKEASVIGTTERRAAICNVFPPVVIVILSPIALICLMGLFFTFITSITCSISVMRIEKKGKKAVMAYFLYRFMFGVVLKLMYTFLLNWWDKFGLFDTMKIAFPETELSTSGNTLDSIGACGFLVPVAVYYIRKLPFARDWKVQVGILTSVAVVLLYFYLNIADFAILLSDWFKKYRFNFISMLLSIVGTGPFMIAQCLPFGLVGGALCPSHDELEEVEASLDLHRYSRSRRIVVVIIFFITNDNPFDAIMDTRKPCFVRFLELSFEVLIIVIAVYLSGIRGP